MPHIMKMWMEAATADVGPIGLTEEELKEAIRKRTAEFSDEQLGAMMKRVQEKHDRAASGIWKDVHVTLLDIEKTEFDSRKLIRDTSGKIKHAVALKETERLEALEAYNKLCQKTWQAHANKVRPRCIEEVVGKHFHLEWERQCRIKIAKPRAENRRMVLWLWGIFFIAGGLIVSSTLIVAYEVLAAALAGAIPGTMMLIAGYYFGIYEQPEKIEEGQIEAEIEDRILHYVQKFENHQRALINAEERRVNREREIRRARRRERKREDRRAQREALLEEQQKVEPAEAAKQEALKTKPHVRPECPVFPFTYGKLTENFCSFCRCYICDVPCGECVNWTGHCHATEQNNNHKLMRQRSIDLRRLRNPDEAEDGDGEAHGEAAAPAPASASTATADSIEEKPPHVAITISVEATDNSSGSGGLSLYPRQERL